MHVCIYIYIYIYICVFIYIYIINIHSTHTHYVSKTFILDAINRSTALKYILYKRNIFCFIYACMSVYLYIYIYIYIMNIHSTHTLRRQFVLFWMRLIAINRLTALQKIYIWYASVSLNESRIKFWSHGPLIIVLNNLILTKLIMIMP